MSARIPLANIGGLGSPVEMAVIFLAVLLLFGAKQLPEILRGFGRVLGYLRQASEQFRSELMEAERQTRDVKEAWEREIKDITVSSSPAEPGTPPPAGEDAKDV